MRRNHALEHATMAIMQQRDPRIKLIARSSSRGFRVYGKANPADVRSAVEEALRRLRSGERSLAIAPRCGTNIAVGVLLGTLGLSLSDLLRNPRHKLALGLATSVIIAASSHPVGLLAQRHLTTLADLDGLSVKLVTTRSLGRRQLLEVLTG
ncbi:MAG: DUF6391 domain-containing protein [Chloroflexota bacterium]